MKSQQPIPPRADTFHIFVVFPALGWRIHAHHVRHVRPDGLYLARRAARLHSRYDLGQRELPCGPVSNQITHHVQDLIPVRHGSIVTSAGQV